MSAAQTLGEFDVERKCLFKFNWELRLQILMEPRHTRESSDILYEHI